MFTERRLVQEHEETVPQLSPSPITILAMVWFCGTVRVGFDAVLYYTEPSPREARILLSSGSVKCAPQAVLKNAAAVRVLIDYGASLNKLDTASLQHLFIALLGLVPLGSAESEGTSFE